jgi:hypothetical protein
MDCARIENLLSDYLDGSIRGSDLADVETHLRECRRCSAGAEGLKATIALLHGLRPVEAPPELIEKVRTEIGRGRVGRPLWKKLFLPVHVKIPLEAAAVAVLFLLVVATHREQLPKEVPSRTATGGEAAPPAREGKGNAGIPSAAAPGGGPRTAVPRGGSAPPAARQGDGTVVHEGTRASDRPTAGSGVRKETVASSSRDALPKAEPSLPAVPAQRISTEAGRIEPGPVPEEKAQERDLPRLFAAPPSRLMRQVPYGREVTIEVTGENRAGLEERIAAAAVRLGGAMARTPSPAGAPENAAAADRVRVDVPSESAETFLAELSRLGTLPQEGMSAWADFPAGPSPGVVAYTVRIRVR